MPFGPVASYTLGNGQTITRTFDANYRLTDLTSPALNLHFAHDAMGDITALGNAPGANPPTETYSYDPLYRLGSVTEASGTTLESYTYNSTGDRLSKTASIAEPGTGTYSYTSGTHQLIAVGSTARANDANGNTTSSASGSSTLGFGYNARNRMTIVQSNGTTVGMYTYNAMGQRIGKIATTPTAVTERYSYQGNHLLSEYGTTNRDYVWLGGLLVATVDNTTVGTATTTTTNYVHVDGLGTPRAVTNSAGTVVWQWAYVGNPLGQQPPTSTTGYVLNLGFPGQYYDAETGLYYNMHRDFDSGTGRYLQSDPKGLHGGQASTYAYVDGNPLSSMDPLGLESPSAACGGGPGTAAWANCAAPPPPPSGCDSGGVSPGLLLAMAGTVAAGGGPEDPFTDAAALGEWLAADGVVDGAAAAADGANSAVNGLNLGKSLASDEQVGQLLEGDGVPILGAGTDTELNAAEGLSNQYGGAAEDWQKVTSNSYTAGDGTQFETHAYQNIDTGQVVEPKSVPLSLRQ
jgi:RHS repeat-associated protein